MEYTEPEDVDALGVRDSDPNHCLLLFYLLEIVIVRDNSSFFDFYQVLYVLFDFCLFSIEIKLILCEKHIYQRKKPILIGILISGNQNAINIASSN